MFDSTGAHKIDKTSQNSWNVEEFLAGLRFKQRGKLNGLPIEMGEEHYNAYDYKSHR
jgi:hypothetical protein